MLTISYETLGFLWVAYFLINFAAVFLFELVDNNGEIKTNAAELIAFVIMCSGFPVLVFLFGALVRFLEDRQRRGN